MNSITWSEDGSFAAGARRTSFMDGVVSEGLATAFERDAGGRLPPWFQHPDGRRRIGYRAGTYIADQAIAASGSSAADLVLAPTA
jgi:hypothetical protein